MTLVFLLLCRHTAQLALQLCQKRTHVVCSNREARKRPARRHSRNGPWTHEGSFEVMYLYVGSAFRDL